MNNAPIPEHVPHLRRFALSYVLVCLVILAILAWFPSEDRNTSRSLIAIAHPASNASILATLDDNEIRDAQNLKIHLEADTGRDTRLEKMIVCVSSPDFTTTPASGCIPVKLFNNTEIEAVPAAAVVLLTPTHRSGNSKVLVTASWLRYIPRTDEAVKRTGRMPAAHHGCGHNTSLCEPVVEKMVMSLGPIYLGADKWSRFAGRLSRFLKDLTLPILLIFLANWLTREAAERDRRREESERVTREQKDAKEKHDEQSRLALERQQEEQKQIAHILLPKVMTLSGHYYLPLAANLKQFLRATNSDFLNTKEAAFYLLSFFHVARTLKEEEGGIFFKDMAGEQIFTIANNVTRGLIVEAVSGEKQYMLLLNQFETWLPKGVNRWPRYGEQPDVLPASWLAVEEWLSRA